MKETTKGIANGVKPPPGTPGGAPKPEAKKTLDDMVKSILSLVEKIEPKLPQQVLA